MTASKVLLGALAAVGVVGLLFIAGGKLLGHRTVERPFRMTETRTGQPFTEQSLAGQPTALFFGFTSCPEVCPTALATVGRWLKALGPDANGLRVLFVSVDPERDTPELMEKYLGGFDPRIGGLWGPRSETDRIEAAFDIVARRVPSGNSYAFDHTALVLLFNRQGQHVDSVDFEDPQEKVLGKLRAVMAP